MKIVIDEARGCKACPFLRSYPEVRCSATRRVLVRDDWPTGSTPEWCPLRNGPVTVEMPKRRRG